MYFDIFHVVRILGTTNPLPSRKKKLFNIDLEKYFFAFDLVETQDNGCSCSLVSHTLHLIVKEVVCGFGQRLYTYKKKRT